MTPTITLTDSPDADVRGKILEPLIAFNEASIGGPEGTRRLAVLLSEPTRGEIVGGLWGTTSFRHLFVELIFIPEAMRRGGIGREIIRQAEEEAARRGFYEHLGYTVFGTIDDYPPGHSRFFLKKQLVSRSRAPSALSARSRVISKPRR